MLRDLQILRTRCKLCTTPFRFHREVGLVAPSLAIASLEQMQKKSAFPALLFFVILAIGGCCAYVFYDPFHPAGAVVVGGVGDLAARGLLR